MPPNTLSTLQNHICRFFSNHDHWRRGVARDDFWHDRGINNAQQAAWLAEAASLSSSTGMVRCLIVWNLDFSRYGDDPQDGYAIIRPDGSCPACATLGAVMGQ